MIGGHDITFKALANLPAKSLILARMQEEWPQAVVEDDPSGEFFVFRDKDAQEAWDGQPDNSMLHFLIGEAEGHWRSITIVCDDPVPQPLIDDLRITLCPMLHRILKVSR